MKYLGHGNYTGHLRIVDPLNDDIRDPRRIPVATEARVLEMYGKAVPRGRLRYCSEFPGVTAKTIAAALGITETTVHKVLQRKRRIVRRHS